MDPVKVVSGPVTSLARADVDTDQIIPKQFLKRIERTGFGEFLFYDWAQEPGWSLPKNPILATGPNFVDTPQEATRALELSKRSIR